MKTREAASSRDSPKVMLTKWQRTNSTTRGKATSGVRKFRSVYADLMVSSLGLREGSNDKLYKLWQIAVKTTVDRQKVRNIPCTIIQGEDAYLGVVNN